MPLFIEWPYEITGVGIGSLNGLSVQNQFLVTGSAGSDFNIVSSVNTHTLNIPTASAINRGLLSPADWTAFNAKAPLLDYMLQSVYDTNLVGQDIFYFSTAMSVALGY